MRDDVYNKIKFLIPPINKALWHDVNALRLPLFPRNTQVRIGRYVINSDILPCECLFLDFDDNVIDGFVGSPVIELPWKGKTFTEHLRELNGFWFIKGYDDIYTPEIIEEAQQNFSDMMDRKAWED